MCSIALEIHGCTRPLKLRIKPSIVLRCLQRCLNSSKQVCAHGMFKCIWCSHKKRRKKPRILPPPLHAAPLQSRKQCTLSSSHLTTVSLCRPGLNLFNTDEHKIQAYFSLCKLPHTNAKGKQRTAAFHFFPGMNRAFNINTEMEVISTIYWILKHLWMFSQTVYLIGWTRGHLILGENMLAKAKKQLSGCFTHIFKGLEQAFFCFKNDALTKTIHSFKHLGSFNFKIRSIKDNHFDWLSLQKAFTHAALR